MAAVALATAASGLLWHLYRYSRVATLCMHTKVQTVSLSHTHTAPVSDEYVLPSNGGSSPRVSSQDKKGMPFAHS